MTDRCWENRGSTTNGETRWSTFIKVEATKFTEVGYVGRDVESMVRDLVETSVRIVKEEMVVKVQDKAEEQANQRLVEILVPSPEKQSGFKIH